MSTLVITRESSYPDRFRSYGVMLDGKKIGELGNAESKQFTIAPGTHAISLKIDWCGSRTLDFSIAEGETLAFSARSNLQGAKIFLALWYTLFDQNGYLLIEKKTG